MNSRGSVIFFLVQQLYPETHSHYIKGSTPQTYMAGPSHNTYKLGHFWLNNTASRLDHSNHVAIISGVGCGI